jgi:hypothetical protein
VVVGFSKYVARATALIPLKYGIVLSFQIIPSKNERRSLQSDQLAGLDDTEKYRVSIRPVKD